MHELSIALGIVDIAEEESDRRGGVAVLSVHIKLGPLSGVVKEALTSAYELAREGSGCRRFATGDRGDGDCHSLPAVPDRVDRPLGV